MAEVASAFVSLLPSAKGFGKSLESQVGRDIDTTGKKMGSRIGGALKVGLVAGVAGAGIAAAGFLKGALGEAREAQKVGALTASTIKATGSAAQVTAQHISDMAGKLSAVTGIDDETIQSGQNMLLTFKNIRNEVDGKFTGTFDKATKALVDMSAAMGTDPKKAAIGLGKALNDPVKGMSALSRVGVAFTETQKATVKSLIEGGSKNAVFAMGLVENQDEWSDALKANKGDIEATAKVLSDKLTPAQRKHYEYLKEGNHITQAQAIILKELKGEFGGAAAAQATAGEKAKVAWGNFQEAVGTMVLPLWDKILGGGTKVLQFLTNNIGPAFGKIKDFIRPVKDALSRLFDPLKDGGLTKAFDNLDVGPVVDGIVGAFKGLADKINLGPTVQKIKRGLQGIDLPNLAKGFRAQAETWAAPIIAGFKTGLDTGDWSGLGKSLGEGLVRAIKSITKLAGKIGGLIGDMFAKVDWVGLGIAIGKQVPSLLVGLVAGILNFDLMGLLKGVGAHWQDILLAVIAIAFTPGKIIGKVAEMLARIPLVGRLLGWALVHFKGFSDGLVGMVGRALGFMGRAFLAGFRKVFPNVGRGLTAALDLLPTRLGVMALELQEKALGMVRGIGKGIAKGTEWVVGKIGELVALILRAFVNAHLWLFRKGAEIVAGLGRGLRGGFRAVLDFAAGIGGRILSQLGDFKSLLKKAGEQLIQGLIQGIGDKIRDLKKKVSDVAGTIKKFFPGSPVKQGPLTSWNRGGAGKRLVGMLTDGLGDTRALERASGNLASRVNIPSPRYADLHTTAATTVPGVGGAGGPVFHIDEVRAHDYQDFTRQMQSRAARAQMGGF